MTTPLLLVAAGGLGREVAVAAMAGDSLRPSGFVDDDPSLWGTAVDGLPVLGGLEVIGDHPGALVVLCAGQGAARLDLERRLRRLGLDEDRYATIIHPMSDVPLSCRPEAGSVVLSGAVMTTAVTLGRHVVCMPRVVLTHDDALDSGVTLGAGATLGGDVRIGSSAYLGMSCSVRQGVRIGAGSVIGMGAVVLRDVPDGETWFGVPATPRTARQADAGCRQLSRQS